jgi:hypothetical protein
LFKDLGDALERYREAVELDAREDS